MGNIINKFLSWWEMAEDSKTILFASFIVIIFVIVCVEL